MSEKKRASNFNKPPQEKSLQQRVEEGEFDREVLKMMARMGLVESTMPFAGMQGIEQIAKAGNPEQLHLGVAELVRNTNMKASVDLASAQVASLEAKMQKGSPSHEYLNRLTESFEAFYYAPNDENHEKFLNNYRELVLSIEKEANERENEETIEEIIPVLEVYAGIENELYEISKNRQEAQNEQIRKKVSESVKQNAEIQGVEKARDVLVDSYSQQVTPTNTAIL